MRRWWLLSFALLLGGLLGVPARAAQDEQAAKLVREVSQEMLATLEKRRAEVDRNPSLIFGLRTSSSPHFSIATSSSRNWFFRHSSFFSSTCA